MACSVTPNSDRDARQREVITRWERCVHREADRLDRQSVLLRKRAGRVCEGYRRDVLDTYPPHLTPRIDDLLIDRTADRLVVNATRQVRGTGWQGTCC